MNCVFPWLLDWNVLLLAANLTYGPCEWVNQSNHMEIPQCYNYWLAHI